MKAMIMAAGLGTRLLPLTRLISKPMVPVLDRPLMEHLLLLLRGHGFTDLAANLHYQPFDMPQRFDDGSAFGVSLRYEFELELSGTAGGTGLFRDFLSRRHVPGDERRRAHRRRPHQPHRLRIAPPAASPPSPSSASPTQAATASWSPTSRIG